MADISHVFTITYVAEMLGEDEDWLHELSIDMFPEDGRLYVERGKDDAVTAFTEDGIENLKQIIADMRADALQISRRLLCWITVSCFPNFSIHSASRWL